MSAPLYKAVLTELENISPLLWLTPYLGKRQAILEQLKSHLEEGDATLTKLVAPASLDDKRTVAAERAFKFAKLKIDGEYGPWEKAENVWTRKVNWQREDGPGSRSGVISLEFTPDTAEIIKFDGREKQTSVFKIGDEGPTNGTLKTPSSVS